MGEEGAEAKKELYKNLEKVEDPLIRAYIEKVLEVEQDPYYKPIMNIAIKYINEAVKHGLHRDREKFFQYLATSLIQTAHEISKHFPTIDRYELEQAYGMERAWSFRALTHPWHLLSWAVEEVLEELEKEGVEDASKWKKHMEELLDKITKARAKALGGGDWRENPGLAYSALVSVVQNTPYEYILRKPEEYLGIEGGEEEAPPGAKILARPDRYPTLTQKILLKALILGELQREDHGVHRNLYRALRNLLESPLTTANWYPLLAEWFEELEKGNHVSPLTLILQKLPVDPLLKTQAYQYLSKIEQGTPLDQIPGEEKKAFRQLMERVKEEIWKNPKTAEKVIEEFFYNTGLTGREAAKALIGAIHDLTLIHVGEKTPRQVGIERDATQILHLLQGLEDKGNYIDPYQIAQKLTNIIEQHIQDPLLREAYKQAIQHYRQTYPQIPRNETYLENIIEKERELERKLEEMEHEGRKLGRLEAKRVANLYRILMLLTPYPGLRETKNFYSRLAQRLKVRVGGEEFLPVHGPVAEDVASLFSEIRRTPPERRQEVVKMGISRSEALMIAAPHAEKAVKTVLATVQTPVVPREKHEKFLRNIEKAQLRRTIEG